MDPKSRQQNLSTDFFCFFNIYWQTLLLLHQFLSGSIFQPPRDLDSDPVFFCYRGSDSDPVNLNLDPQHYSGRVIPKHSTANWMGRENRNICIYINTGKKSLFFGTYIKKANAIVVLLLKSFWLLVKKFFSHKKGDCSRLYF